MVRRDERGNSSSHVSGIVPKIKGMTRNCDNLFSAIDFSDADLIVLTKTWFSEKFVIMSSFIGRQITLFIAYIPLTNQMVVAGSSRHIYFFYCAKFGALKIIRMCFSKWKEKIIGVEMFYIFQCSARLCQPNYSTISWFAGNYDWWF